MSASPTFSRGIVFVGCGRMGGALLAGCLARGVVATGNVLVIEPGTESRNAAAQQGVAVAADSSALDSRSAPDLVLLAVKPQMMDDVLPAYARLGDGDTVFLSIAAGRTTQSFTRLLGARTPVVRAMPNTPAQVGRGVTALFPSETVTPAQKDMCAALMSAVGEVAWLDDESLMDAVTAVSGSGPAYVFHLIEALAEAARAAGLPADMADTLARATVTGAAELAYQSSEDPGRLREQVTSPGGTTAAALEVLMGDKGLTDLMTRAVAAAKKRSEELAG